MNNCHIIFGAPGCGKTTRLMEILEILFKEYPPNRLAFASFTRKGTYEGVARARDRFGYKEADLPYFRTLHSLAFRDGNYHKTDIIQKRHYKDFSAAMGMNFLGYYTEDFFNNDDKYIHITMLERNNPKIAERFNFNIDVPTLNAVRHNYIKFKAFARVVDFTEILETFIARNKALPVDAAIIDEAQDLTSLQWKFCEIAFRDCKKVYIAGDDDQAIYEWSGADIPYFLSLQGKREILQQSYRLQKQILTLSKSISAMIGTRVDKQFNPINDEGTIHFHNTIDDVPLIKNQSYYFLSRNNYFLYIPRDFLRRNAEVFIDKDKLSIDMRETDAIRIYERSRKQTLTDIEQVKLNAFAKDHIDIRRPWYDNLNFDADRIAYYKDLIRAKTDLNDRRITVSTIHGVKGGEADNVVLLLDFTQAVKLNLENNPDSELRCLYVACTRAKKNLHLVHSNSKNGYDEYIPLQGE